MSHKRANSNVNDSSEGENDEWYNDVIEFLPSQLEGNPKGYVNYDDDVIRQEPLKKNFKLTEDNYIDEEEEEERGEGDIVPFRIPCPLMGKGCLAEAGKGL